MSTTHYEAHHDSSVYGFIRSLAAATLWLARKPVHFYQSRSVLTELSGMSDHELSDIGLTRTDVAAAAAVPSDIDPTAVLAGLAQERRQWRRGR